MSRKLLQVVSVAAALSAACLYPPIGAAQMPADYQASVVDTVALGKNNSGQIDYTSQVLTATGTGIPVPGQPAAQAARGALRAAITDARRNLVALVQGVHVDAETVVRDHMIASDVVRERISGIVKGAVELPNLRTTSPDGTVNVTVALGIRNQLAGAVLPADGFDPLPVGPPPLAPPIDRTGSILLSTPPLNLPPLGPSVRPGAPGALSGAPTGLIIDARGLDLRPAMAPKVLNEAGEEVYGTRAVSRTWAIQMGVATYGKDLDAPGTADRVGSNPLMVKAVKSAGKNNVNVVISDTDAAAIAAAESTAGFLSKCRVMFLVD